MKKDTPSDPDVRSSVPTSPSAEPTVTVPEPAEGPERSDIEEEAQQPCPNCGDTTSGRYCRACGQEKRAAVASLRVLISDLVDQFILHRKLPSSVLFLLTRPGFLTKEYISGRIVRYTAPFRLYLMTSIVFFLLLSFFGLRTMDNTAFGDVPSSAATNLAAGLAALEQIDTTGMPVETQEAIDLAMSGLSERLDEEAGNATAGADSDDFVTRPGMQPWAIEMSRSQNRGVSRVLVERVTRRYGHLPAEAASREMFRQYVEYVPHTVFMLLPIFALVLKVLYVRRRRYYVEHFIFALHVHAFVFLALTLMLLIGNESVRGLLTVGVGIYVWLAMKKVYGQGWLRTTAKYAVLGFAYSMLVGIGAIVPMAILLLLA
jgi:hypothetical protein